VKLRNSVIARSCYVVAATLLVQGRGPVPKAALLTKKTAPITAPPTAAEAAKPRIIQNYGNLPLTFEANQGQTDAQVKFLSRGSGYTLFLTSTEAVLALSSPGESETGQQAHTKPSVRLPHTRLAESRPTRQTLLRMKLVGANSHAHVKGLEEQPDKSNYFIGNDPTKWRIDVPTYAQVEYQDVYPGVNLIYYGNQRRLEHDFVVAPGADPSLIRLAFQGADDITLDTNGNLVLRAVDGKVTLQAPLIYQEINGTRESIAGHYVLQDKAQVGFRLAAYDTRKPLIIDPILSYATYLGGSSFEQGLAIAVDASGNAYVTGSTYSTNFPLSNPFQPSLNGGADVFISKLNATGSALVYSTYFGGSAAYIYEKGSGIAVDSAGNAYIVGQTDSSDFPTTVGAFDRTFHGGNSPIDAFVTKLNPAGNGLVYSTYLGGNGEDAGLGIALDSLGNAYVTGYTNSTDFPTMNAFQASFGGGITDVFVTKLNVAGSALVYSTYLGGSGNDQGLAIAVDSSGSAYVTGITDHSLFTTNNFPTVNAFQPACRLGITGVCGGDAFVTKLSASGNSLVYSTFLGGSRQVGDNGSSAGRAIAVDSAGNAYVTGATDAIDFPTTTGAYRTACGTDNKCNGPAGDVFITKFNANGTALVYSTYLGGSSSEAGYGIAADAFGNAYVTGLTNSTDFPTMNPFEPSSGGGGDAFVTELNATGSALVYSSFLGGSGPDQGLGIALDALGNAYVVGSTNSTDFPTQNPLQAAFGGGGGDAFVAKISAGAPQITSIAPVSGTQGTTLATFTVNGANFQPTSVLSLSGAGITVNSYSSRTATQIVASITLAGNAPTGARDVIVTNPDLQQATLTGGFLINPLLLPTISVAPPSLTFPPTPLNATSSQQLFTVTNTGSALLSITAVVAPSGFAVSGPVPTSLAPGGQAMYNVTFMPNGPGPFSGNVSFTSNDPTSPITLVPVQGTVILPDLTLTKTASPNPVTSGQTLTYTLTVQKTLDAALNNVTVTDTLPTGMSNVACQSAAACNLVGNILTASLGTLTTAGSYALTITATAPLVASPTPIVNVASVATTSPEQNTGNNQASQMTTVNPAASIAPPRTFGTAPGQQQLTSNEPVNTATGNYFHQHTDFVIPGRGLPLVFQRTYNVLDTYAGPLGAGWTHSYNAFLSELASGAVIIKWGDGHAETFTPSGSSYISPPGIFSVLAKNADGTFTLKQKNQIQYRFSSTGRLGSVQDRNGNATTLAYSPSGNLTQITDTVGRNLTFLYDASNRISQITDPIGRTAAFAYSVTNDLINATDPAGGITQFSYDVSHRVTSITQPNGQLLLTNAYDASGRVATQTNGRGFTTTFAYGAPNSTDTTITDARGNKTVHTYDSSLRILKLADAAGGLTQFAYDANNDRTSVTNQNGKTTTFAYDAQGNITGITDPLANAIAFTYDSKSNPLSATNAKGKNTSFLYDAKGNLTRITDAASNLTQFGYDGFGELNSKTDARGNTTTYTYSTAGALMRIADALANATNLAYDGIGRLVSITDANGHTATANYDALSRLTKITDPLTNQTQFAYDSVGDLLKITDANGHATNYGYDAANNLATVTDALGNVTQYAYDQNNNRTTFTNANGNATSYTYDALNRLMRIADPLSFATVYGYDAVGNVLAINDAKAQTNQFTYDAVNRLIGTSYADGKTVTYLYDPNGNRTNMVDSHGTTAYGYDSLDRLISVNHPGAKVVIYAYDAVGNRKSLTYPDGTLVSYAYDAVNRLSQATDWLGRSTQYNYDAASNLVKTLHPNQTHIDFSYDAANRLTRVMNSTLGLPLLRLDYTLDPVGNRRTLSADGVQTVFGYDALNQLASAQLGPLKTMWAYDPAGNRSKETSPFGTTTYTYDSADRLLSAGATAFSYDANGNQIKKTAPSGTVTYAYDPANRLVAASRNAVNSQFTYDGDGNRVAQVTTGGTYAYINDVATALPVVLNEQGPDGNITYAYGLGLIEEFSSKFNYFYHYDALGSIVALTDAAGKPQAAYAYDPWGNPLLNISDSVGTKNKLRFTGEELDPGTGLYYLRARYYDPSVGRFLSRDPLSRTPSNELSQSAYLYARNSPLYFIDPSGLSVVPSSLSLAGSFNARLDRYFNSLNPYSVAQLGVDLGSAAVDLFTPTFLPQGAWWRVITSHSDALTNLDLANLVLDSGISAWKDLQNPNLTTGGRLGRASLNVGLGAIPGVNLAYGAAKVFAPAQTDAAVNSFLSTLDKAGEWAMRPIENKAWFQRWASKPHWLDF
jgi:RHS repeat-associated protein/uncharacterized repeat protein (TIGR01451 family)